MTGYLLKRLLLVIPAMLLLSILVFFLMDQMTADIVRNELEAINWESKAYSQTDNYRLQDAIVKKYNYQYPLFYFSLSRKAYPDSLHQIFPVHKREFIKRLSTSYSDKNLVNALIKRIDSAAIDIPEFNRLYLANREILFEEELSHLHVSHPHETSEIGYLLDELKKERGDITRFIPRLLWNGSHCRYHLWLRNFLQFDFGRSIQNGLPIRQRMVPALSISMKIGIPAILILFLISVPFGIYLANSANLGSNIIINTIYILQAMPLFWIAELLLIFFASRPFLQLFPSFGTGSSSFDIKNAALPVLSLVISGMPIVILQTKKSIENLLGLPFFLMAKSKGLSEKRILWKHVLRNALTPIITLFFSFLPSAVAGVMIVEFVFSIPGAGRLLVEAIGLHDHLMILILIMMVGLIKILSGIMADIAYRMSDPRVTFR